MEYDDDIEQLLYGVWLLILEDEIDSDQGAKCFVKAWQSAAASQELRDNEA